MRHLLDKHIPIVTALDMRWGGGIWALPFLVRSFAVNK